jgi:hypothetical protein
MSFLLKSKINQIEMQAVSGNDRNHVGKLTVNVYKNITATVMNKISISFIVRSHIYCDLIRHILH